MDMSASAQRKLVGQNQRAHVGDLLRRYPGISAGEAAEIIRFIKKGPVMEVGLLTADEELRPQLQRFRSDHASEFSLGIKEYAIILLIVAGAIGLCFFLWDIGAGR